MFSRTVRIDKAHVLRRLVLCTIAGLAIASSAFAFAPSNSAPVANAGSDLSVACQGSVTLDGSGSFDPDGDALTYDWYEIVVIGGQRTTIRYSTEMSPTLTLSAGTHTIQLVVRDPYGGLTRDTVVVTVEAMDFEGFLEPIGGADASGGSFEDPIRAFKLGSTVPVKFKAMCCGAPVLDGIHTLQAVKWNTVVSPETPIDATPTDAATPGNQFRLVGDQWHFNMSTEGLTKGTWKLTATLSDSSEHIVWITLK